MRIIAGKAGRIAIKVPPAVARPTTDFVRQAVFSILGGRVENARVLDLFSGSGAIGLEALSRGAASCVFVDEHRQAGAVITENLAKTRLEGGRVVKAEVASFLKRDASCYDLIFADPPYWKHHGDRDHVGDLLKSNLLAPRLAADGWFIAEISANQTSPSPEHFTLIDRREYGGSAILLYALTAIALLASPSLFADEAAKKEDVIPYKLDTCIVSGEKLGEMGKPYVFVHESQEIKLCCKSCLKKFNKEPEKYLKKLEEKK